MTMPPSSSSMRIVVSWPRRVSISLSWPSLREGFGAWPAEAALLVALGAVLPGRQTQRGAAHIARHLDPTRLRETQLLTMFHCFCLV
jgi:hypothetical protein